jgi:release factor glutamine methyltransferase
MSGEEAKRRIDWQNRVYEMHLKEKEPASIDFNGRKIIVLKNVFAPVPWDYNLLARSVLAEVKETDKVLDMGTGSGIQAILAASKSSDVTAVDVNPSAVECTRCNVEINKLSSRITTVESDLFEKVDGRYDLIIFDPPFRWSAPRDLWERSCADKDYATLKKFFEEAKQHLKDNGRMLIAFGTSGDLAYLKQLIRKNGFRRKQILKNSRVGWTYFTYRLTF